MSNGLVVQHNMSAINANNKMNVNVSGLQKATEKLSSGYQINRAGDNASGLAVSEKMRSQIRGLSQAVKNTNDGISLIQTAEGGLNETHSILQRMRELSVQASNGTYTDSDREAIQLEVDALKSEIDRISESTEYNTMKLLDGSLGGTSSTNNYGALYGSNEFVEEIGGGRITTTSTVAGMSIAFTTGASGEGGENAVWSDDGLSVTVNLVDGVAYTDDQINDLIENATVPKNEGMSAPYGEITFKSAYGVIVGAEANTTATSAGVRSYITADVTSLVSDKENGGIGSSDTIKFTANSYGATEDNANAGLLASITIATDVGAGDERIDITQAYKDDAQSATITLHLSTGVQYTEKDLENLLASAGFDYSVTMTDETTPDGANDGVVLFNVADEGGVAGELTEGAGVGKEYTGSTGEGLTLQIGANGVEDQRVTLNVDDMGSDALGVANIDISTVDKANDAINSIDDAIEKVSLQRAGLGALQNRLEYTVNNLTTTNENLTSAESQIRDTDMATEMINYTKYNILQQASQAMLAQANQQPQAVLQLLG